MIDKRAATADLVAKLGDALPVAARLTPELRAMLRAQMGETAIPATGTITALHYMGDEGGVLCKLDLGTGVAQAAHVSITHLRFDPTLPLARAITAYQEHRVRGLRRQPAR